LSRPDRRTGSPMSAISAAAVSATDKAMAQTPAQTRWARGPCRRAAGAWPARLPRWPAGSRRRRPYRWRIRM